MPLRKSDNPIVASYRVPLPMSPFLCHVKMTMASFTYITVRMFDVAAGIIDGNMSA